MPCIIDSPHNMKSKDNILVLLGALIGGVLGHFIFFWVTQQGFYGLILPGAGVGIGAGFFAAKTKWMPISCGVFALLLGLFTEWRYSPFVKDESLGYFLTHIYELKPITLIMIIAGGFLGFWIPFGKTRSKKKA